MKQKINESVKKHLSKYGLKDSNRAKVEQIVASRIEAMGDIGADDLDGIIEKEVKACEPYMDVMQAEIESVRQSRTNPNPNPNPNPNEGAISKEDISKIVSDALAKQAEEVIKPLQTQLHAFQSQKLSDEMIASVRTKMLASNAGKVHKDSIEDAFDIVMGSKDFDNEWTSEQFETAVINRFNKRASVPYADVPAPIDGEDKTKETVDWSEEINRKKEQGLIPTN